MAMAGGVDAEVHDSAFLSKSARLIAKLCSVFYNFDGVRRFKAKFAPSWWENEYIVMSQNVTAPPRILRAFVRAIVPAGPSVLVARQVNRAWRRMSSASAAAPAHARLVGKTHDYEQQSVDVNGLSLNYVSAGTGRPARMRTSRYQYLGNCRSRTRCLLSIGQGTDTASGLMVRRLRLRFRPA